MRLLLQISIVALLGWSAVRVFEWLSPLARGWTPSAFAEVGGAADRAMLASVKDDPRWCRAVLSASDVSFERVPDRSTGPGCGFNGAVRLTGTVWSPRSPVMTCPLAVAASLWERRVVRPTARANGTRLTALQHYGTYSCRAIAGSDRRSEHSTANALDIAGFRFSDGTSVSVRRDWDGPAKPAALLRDVHAGGCLLFGTVLGPGYNAAHRDHFHFDMANWSYCP